MNEEEAQAWSPLLARHLAGPQRIITRGEEETAPFHNQAMALNAMLDREGQATELRIEPNRNHLTIVFDLADPGAPLGRRLHDLVRSS